MTKQELITKWEKEVDDLKTIIPLYKKYPLKQKFTIGRKIQLLRCLEELKNLNEETRKDEKICPHCHKYRKMQGNGIMHQLCECGD